jgi:hypothetical protein
MSEIGTPREEASWLERVERELLELPLIRMAGLVYLGLGIVLGLGYFVGGVQASLFPTGWIFPVVLVLTGLLMTARRRFDIVMTLWGVFAAAVFYLDFTNYMTALNVGFENFAAFDATIIVAAFALVPLVLRPQFRR